MLSTGEALLSTGVLQIKLAIQQELTRVGAFNGVQGLEPQSSFELTTLDYEQVALHTVVRTALLAG